VGLYHSKNINQEQIFKVLAILRPINISGLVENIRNINVFSPVIHRKKTFLSFCYINLYITISTRSCDGAISDPSDSTGTNLNLLVLRLIRDKYQCIQSSGSGDLRGFFYCNLYKIISSYDRVIFY